MRTIFLGFFVLLASSTIYAQDGKLFFEVNYNTFSHSGLKDFQQEFIRDVGEVNVQVNDNFPSFFGFTAGYKISSINTSIFASYTSTGGKISYSDFSGVIRLTQPLKGYTLGGMYEIPLSESSNGSSLHFAARGFATYSTLDITSFNELNGISGTETISTSSLDFGGGVALIFEYPLSFVRLRASAGFDLVLGGKQYLTEDRDFFIQDNNGDAVRTGWSGARLGIGAAIPL